eukprot:m.825900 g.825900  ORF g.825900 m.825900 type:complete len:303 (-) comp23410_c0_seq1:2715-3623(-)
MQGGESANDISAMTFLSVGFALFITFLLPMSVRSSINGEDDRGRVAVELQEKSTRLKWLSARWTCCCLCMVAGILPPFRPSLYLYPSTTSLLGWLWTWHFKAIIDVIEDVLPSKWKEDPSSGVSHFSSRNGFMALYVLCAAVPCFSTPVNDPTICIAYGTMLTGSLLAGGVDTATWQGLACVCAMGVARGLPGVLAVATTEDLFAVAAAAAVFALLEAMQDRLMDKWTEQDETRGRCTKASNVLFALLRLKLLPVGAVLAMNASQVLPTSALVGALVDFAIYSPHFVVYDGCKVLLCNSILR